MEAEFSGDWGLPGLPLSRWPTLLGALAIAACSRPAASGVACYPYADPGLGEAPAPGEETTAAGGGGLPFSRQYQVPASGALLIGFLY